MRFIILLLCLCLSARGQRVTMQPDLIPGDPSVFWVYDEFVGGLNTTGNVGSGWILNNIGSAPVVAALAGTYPHLGSVTLATNAGATQGQGGSLTLTPGAAVNSTFGDLGTNTNWSFTYIFALSQTTATRFRIGMADQGSALSPNSHIGLRFDTNAPGAATISAAPTGAVRDATGTIATFTTGVHGFTLVGQTVTIASVTDTTFNGACVIATIPSTTTFTCPNAGTANATSGSGTATPVAETNFMYVAKAADNSHATVTNSGVAADTGWHKIVASSTVAGTVVFTLDANAPVTISTNVPTAASTAVIVLGADTTAQKTVNIDMFSFKMRGLNR